MNDPFELLKQARPTLLSHITVVHRVIRSEPWVVLTNELSGEHMRLNISAWQRITSFDSRATLAESGLDIDNELAQLLLSLHQRGMISLGTERESDMLVALQRQLSKRDWQQRWLNPLYMRFSLFDPDDLLGKHISRFDFLFHRRTLWVVTLTVLLAVIFGLFHAGELKQALVAVAESPVHWWLYLLAYPILKLLHEFAHALCIKRFGGQVHETGITLLVLLPLPYINASDAWSFVDRRKRLLVNISGMAVEGFLAAIALVLWCLIENGALRDLALAVAMLGSISAFLFNANPLLKFDGYFLLQDALDIPNLSSRSNRYYSYLVRRYLFKVDAQSPVTADGERRWFLIYGAAATLYRYFIFAVIAIWLIGKFQIFGALLMAFGMSQLVVTPILRAWRYLTQSEELATRRQRAGRITAAICMASLLFLFVIPMPSSTRVEGVVWVPAQAQVFAAEDGYVNDQLAADGEQVETGQKLFDFSTPALHTKSIVTSAMRDETEVSYRDAQLHDPGAAVSLANELAALDTRAENMQHRLSNAAVKTRHSGRFSARVDRVLKGSKVDRGELLGYVVDPSELRVRAVVPQSRVGKLQKGVKSVSVRLSDKFDTSLPGQLVQQTPAANNQLPSAALAYDGLNGIVVASDEDVLTTRERMFHIEVALPAGIKSVGIGGKAYVTLAHGWEPLGARLWRSTRQLFLRKLAV